MLRIGVDFHAFDGKFQGSRSHLIGLYRAMVARCPDIHFVFFLDKASELRWLEGFTLPNVSCDGGTELMSCIRSTSYRSGG